MKYWHFGLVGMICKLLEPCLMNQDVRNGLIGTVKNIIKYLNGNRLIYLNKNYENSINNSFDNTYYSNTVDYLVL